MLNCFVVVKSSESMNNAIPVSVVAVDAYSAWLENQSDLHKSWLTATNFKAEAGAIRLIPDMHGNVARAICCVTDPKNMWNIGSLPMVLPEGNYRFDVSDEILASYALVWGLGAYQFTRYKKPLRLAAKLSLSEEIYAQVESTIESVYLVRDCINTPADDMGPTEFAAVAEELAKQYGASCKQIIGEDLIKENYRSIYTVGRASDDAPRLIDIRWGNTQHPKITLVGKGVCFDTGGLDLKGSSHMLLMKKDMGGAANVLGLARMIMHAKLPICLRVLIPMVENAVSGNAYRPGDIITTRKGLTVEVGNTDAEGRLVLADALTEAVSENPELLIDMSTLTGAARIALGPDLPAVFSNEDTVVTEVINHGNRVFDPMWRMPLFAQYREYLNSTIADINNASTEGYGGAITAALYLNEFVPKEIPWLHFDIMAWNLRPKPGKPQGGEGVALRAIFAYLQAKFV